MKRYGILRHPSVADDLADIARLIADYAGTEIALRTVDEIETVIQKLGEVPHKGSLQNEIAHGLRAIPAAGKGVVSFVVDDKHQVVHIMAIGYAGSDWTRVARSRN